MGSHSTVRLFGNRCPMITTCNCHKATRGSNQLSLPDVGLQDSELILHFLLHSVDWWRSCIWIKWVQHGSEMFRLYNISWNILHCQIEWYGLKLSSCVTTHYSTFYTPDSSWQLVSAITIDERQTLVCHSSVLPVTCTMSQPRNGTR